MLTLVQSDAAPPPELTALQEGPPWLDSEDVVCARVYQSGTLRCIDWQDVGVFSFRVGDMSVQVWPHPTPGANSIEQIFKLHVQPLVLQCGGFQTLHASGVSGRRGAVVFCGRSGVGKSTLAAQLSREGLEQIADDSVVVSVTSSTPEIVRLPSGSRLPLGRIVLLERSDEPVAPTATDLDGPHALTSVLSHAKVFDLAGTGADLVAAYASLLDRVPVTVLRFHHDRQQLPALVTFVRSVLRELQP